MQLVSKISNLCDHKSPTLQTDRRTDRRHAIARPRKCTKVHCAVKNEMRYINPRFTYLLYLLEKVSVLWLLLFVSIDYRQHNKFWAVGTSLRFSTLSHSAQLMLMLLLRVFCSRRIHNACRVSVYARSGCLVASFRIQTYRAELRAVALDPCRWRPSGYADRKLLFSSMKRRQETGPSDGRTPSVLEGPYARQ